MSRIGKSILTESKLLISGAEERWGWEKLPMGSEFLFGVMNILELNSGDSCTNIGIY